MDRPSSADAIGYRPDIDGLRSIAIVAVVLYHAWPSVVPGGFVGVDVFFVISGYLITRIVVAPRFSYRDFYLRRIRRLFPALLIVLAGTLVAGQLLLPPDDQHRLLEHAIGGALFLANIVSYVNDGYFNGAAELKPLVHLWSLGVEEQFYLFWPVMARLLLGHSFKRWTWLAAITSVAFFVWESDHDVRAAFYLSPARFWELLAGALLVGTTWRGPRAAWGALLGLALIVTSVFLIRSELDFPGALLLLPVCGAVLVIASPGTSIANLLSSKGMVWLGLVSYPLYLWHWPLLSLLRNVDRAPSTLVTAAALVLAILLAEATRRFLERPIARWPLAPGSAALAASMVVGVVLITIEVEATPIEKLEMSNAACTGRYPYRPQGLWFCELSKSRPPTVLLLGDSHANHLYAGLAGALPNESVLSIGACAPTLGLVYPTPKGTKSTCGDGFEAQSDYLNGVVIVTPSLKRVIVSAMWPSFDAEGNEIDYWSGAVVSRFEPVEGTPLRSYVAALGKQLARLGPVRVTIVLDTPRRGLRMDEQVRRQEPFRRAVAELVKQYPNVALFDPEPALCGPASCRWNLLRDYNHLSAEGSDVVARALLQAQP